MIIYIICLPNSSLFYYFIYNSVMILNLSIYIFNFTFFIIANLVDKV